VLADAFADLDAIDQGKAAPPKPRRGQTQAPKKDGDAANAGDGQASGTKTDGDGDGSAADASQTGSTAPPAAADGKPVKAKELREAYQALKERESKEYQPEISRLKARVQELESTGGDLKGLQEKAAAIERRNAELEQHIRFVDFQKSAEYQDRFWKPYVKAWENARRDLNGLQVQFQDETTGEVTARTVTDADLQYIASLEPVQRRQEVKRLFPEDRDEVLRHVNEIVRLAEASEAALGEARQTGDQRLKERLAHARQTQQVRAEAWKSVNESLEKRFPDYFAEKEGDTEGNEVLSKGRVLADLVFNPRAITPAQYEKLPKFVQESVRNNKPLTQEQLALLHATVRNKAAAHDRLARRLASVQKELDDAKKTISQYEQSGPDGGRAVSRRTTTGTGNFMEDAAAELDALDRQSG
jgi:hypothetical protein